MRQTSLITQIYCHDINRIVAQTGREIGTNNRSILLTIFMLFNLTVSMPKS